MLLCPFIFIIYILVTLDSRGPCDDEFDVEYAKRKKTKAVPALFWFLGIKLNHSAVTFAGIFFFANIRQYIICMFFNHFSAF